MGFCARSLAGTVTAWSLPTFARRLRAMAELDVSIVGPVARLVLNRAQSLNALSPSLLTELIAQCEGLARDPTVRVVVLEGAGECFSSGADLPAFLALLIGPDAHANADLGRRAALAVAALPQISIAAIRGHCVGGGVVLAGACDMRLAADDAQFLIPELAAGIPLAWGGMEHLVRLVGETVAADWVLSCRTIEPQEALRAGLVSRVVASEELGAEVTALSDEIATRPLSVLRYTKEQLIAVRSGTFNAARDAKAMLAILKDPEALEVGQRYLASKIRSR